MKKNIIRLILLSSIVLVLAVPVIIFSARSPVLIVTDQSFIPLYGERRIKRQSMRASFSLFRQVKTVIIADDAEDDILQYAITETSARPFCAIFPVRFARGARIYREQNPNIPVILLEGRFSETPNRVSSAIGNNPDDYFIYRTDINTDFYLMGLASVILDREKNERILIYLESQTQTQAREAISRAFNDTEKQLRTIFYTSFTQVSSFSDISCVIISGIGAEYFEKGADLPVICHTWIDPELLPPEIVIVFNDSPWVQAVPAVRMAAAGMKTGLIQSSRVILTGRDMNKETLSKIRKIL